ncbi:MAG TPA: phage integrase N-terminal SAM-like domain-containing protein [Geobacteraceae bacterium]|nr:phage integrase N-terminal SAM-like domain-containing protein [Geobacteraceae bacterium]
MEKPRLLDQVRSAIRIRHYSYRTEQSYVHWIVRYILFHKKRHPKDMGAAEVGSFLSHLHVLNKGEKGVRSPLGRLQKFGERGFSGGQFGVATETMVPMAAFGWRAHRGK